MRLRAEPADGRIPKKSLPLGFDGGERLAAVGGPADEHARLDALGIVIVSSQMVLYLRGGFPLGQDHDAAAESHAGDLRAQHHQIRQPPRCLGQRAAGGFVDQFRREISGRSRMSTIRSTSGVLHA